MNSNRLFTISLLLLAAMLVLTGVAFAGTITNPEQIGGVGVLHVTRMEGVPDTSDAWASIFPKQPAGYHIALSGFAMNADSVEVIFDAVVTDSTYVRMDGHENIWTSVQFRDDCLVTIIAEWERDGHRLTCLDVHLLSIFPKHRPRLQ